MQSIDDNTQQQAICTIGNGFELRDNRHVAMRMRQRLTGGLHKRFQTPSTKAAVRLSAFSWAATCQQVPLAFGLLRQQVGKMQKTA